ncbi:related to hexose transporter protein [Cephalotrichum gorgonifer]|uniref:Related to hexose transporter protein n=1 Tax=Cephalotrichum gorgonifer TaxID=2041049 RepID=A0AAE8SUG9_9PEZI|nr:related to hexose transporter protein [Cephalotrichum gorgonifer]
MVGLATETGGNAAQIARAEAPRFERVQWMKEPHLRHLYFMSIFLLIASATTGYDGMLMNAGQQITKFKDYYHEHGNVFWKDEKGEYQKDANLLGIMVNMFNIGSIISFFITPYVADRFGRKPTIMIGCCIMILGAFVSAFTNGYGMWLAGRFLLGFGNSPAQMCSPMLLTEICHPQHRGPLTAVYNCLWNLGSLLVSVIAWGSSQTQNDWSWRSITLIQALPSIAQLCGIWWIPESPRFLISKDKPEAALAVLAKHHGGGNVNNATVQFQYREIKETIIMEAQAKRSTRYLDFFRTKGNQWRLAIIISLGVISQYSGNAILSNYIDSIYENAAIKEENQKLALTAGKAIMDLIVSICAALTVDKVGRRPLFLFAITGMVLSFVWYAQLVFIWIFSIFYDIGFSGLLVAYALEILPFAMRAKGMMILNITIQAILALGNQTNLLAWDNLPHHWHLMLFYTLWDFVELVFVWFFYVETKGPTLEEIARIFDGDEAVAQIDLEQVEKEIHATESRRRLFRGLRYLASGEDAHKLGNRSETPVIFDPELRKAAETFDLPMASRFVYNILTIILLEEEGLSDDLAVGALCRSVTKTTLMLESESISRVANLAIEQDSLFEMLRVAFGIYGRKDGGDIGENRLPWLFPWPP